ncbi:hypothetical protein PSA7680_01428 [Pseudoruegeria aquimaris]|uniref:Uncharacterized protein n=1 Tax=Pseudoruegeria aquimaris TaxID=393663 RepID=A0A1Y5S4W3_9RHOB|nr:hypothetical protein [Pseudoruegeria aquimaris]SLN30114.1 hypothetical protein PSA7680_01428 [Pseudoruegeria aquimaris]
MTLLPSDRKDDTRATLTALWLAILINAFICDAQPMLSGGPVSVAVLGLSLVLILLAALLPREAARHAHSGAALLMLAELALLPTGWIFTLSQAAALLAVIWMAARWRGAAPRRSAALAPCGAMR